MNTEDDLKRFVVATALKQLPLMPQAERAKLFEGVALLVPNEEAAVAKRTAFLIREAEHQQLHFTNLFR